jgi:hypothetical protein
MGYQKTVEGSEDMWVEKYNEYDEWRKMMRRRP